MGSWVRGIFGGEVVIIGDCGGSSREVECISNVASIVGSDVVFIVIGSEWCSNP